MRKTLGVHFFAAPCTFSAENFVCRLSRSISSHFSAIHCWNVCVAARNREKFTKTPYLGGFKVIHGHWCWHSKEARLKCLLWLAACLCISATISTLQTSQ